VYVLPRARDIDERWETTRTHPGWIARKLIDRARYFAQLHQILISTRAECVYINTIRGSTAALAAKTLKLPIVWHIHGLDLPTLSGLRRARLLVLAYLADRIIAVSEATRQQMTEEYVRLQRAVVIHNGIDLREFQIDPTKVAALRAQLGWVDNPVVGIIGQISVAKGAADFLEAARLIAREMPPVRFLIVGEPASTADEPLVEKFRFPPDPELQGRIFWSGFQKEIATYMALVDLLVIASSYESFGLVAAEAMALGKPVVATKVGGIPEIVHHGITGLLVPPRAPDKISQAVTELLRDEERRDCYGRAGRRRVEEYFAVERYCARIEAVLDSVPR